MSYLTEEQLGKAADLGEVASAEFQQLFKTLVEEQEDGSEDDEALAIALASTHAGLVDAFTRMTGFLIACGNMTMEDFEKKIPVLLAKIKVEEQEIIKNGLVQPTELGGETH